MADYIRPTPRNPILGLLADALTGGVEYMRDPRRAQQMQGLGGLLAETGIPAVVERLSYGEPLTTGRGMTTRLRPEAEAALMTLGPEAVPIGRGAAAAVKATKGLPVGAVIRQVAPQEEALRIAQQRAALPVSEGGLGLPPNNTPMDRAKAMGFESGWAHGSPRSDITELRSSRIGAQGPGAYATNYLPEASTYSGTGDGATVYPLMVRKSEAINTKFNNPYDELGVNADDALLSELFGRNKSAIITTQEKTPDWLLKAGAVDMPQRQHFVSVRPENFRSRFAAFDPTRRNEPDLLAGALPFTALLDEENRALLEERLGGLLGR